MPESTLSPSHGLRIWSRESETESLRHRAFRQLRGGEGANVSPQYRILKYKTVPPVPGRIGTEFRSENILRNRLGMVSVVLRRKVLIPRHSYVH